MPRFAQLPGLPPYGPPAPTFPPEWARIGREGAVVQFVAADGSTWAGNFRPGLGGRSGVLRHPDGRRALVLARGDAWVVDPDTREAQLLMAAVAGVWRIPESEDLLLDRHGLALARLGAAGLAWHTRRLSWDGFDAIALAGGEATGMGWDAVEQRWLPFAVDLASGRSRGGAYASTDVERWERVTGAPGAG